MKLAFLAYNSCAIWQVTLLQMILREQGWQVDTLTPGGRPVVADGGLHLLATQSLETAKAQDYDLCLMAGGDVDETLIADPSIVRFLADFRGWIGASCASAVLLGAAGRIQGPFTCMPNTYETNAKHFRAGQYQGTDLCVDAGRKIITNKGFAHYDLMMALLTEFGVVDSDPHIARLALKLSKNLSPA